MLGEVKCEDQWANTHAQPAEPRNRILKRNQKKKAKPTTTGFEQKEKAEKEKKISDSEQQVPCTAKPLSAREKQETSRR